VQELARVLFDALERSFGGGNVQLINDLFKGSVDDYLRCRSCEKGRSHLDIVLDLSLNIKPWGSTVAFQSIEEAMQNFVEPEVLDGDNSVQCSSCNAKTAHDKGLAISMPPYLLQLQLKRFVFNPYTMAREKLNDRVTYPLILDLNPFVEHGADRAEFSVSTAATAMKNELAEEPAPEGISASADAPGLDDPGSNLPCATVPQSHANSSPAPVLTLAEHRAAMAALVAAKGPHIYELYSVLVHSGTANGGHYYAYIMVNF
jgi:ubiquitin carboxyl-terminal hydrolase 47